MDQQFNWQPLDSINRITDYDKMLFINGMPVQTTTHQVVYGPAQEVLQLFDPLAPPIFNAFSPTYERVNLPFIYNDGVAPGTGNRTVDGTFVYQWDGLNRLIAIRSAADPTNTIIARYRYDADPSIVGGRRVEKEVSNSGSLDGITRFYYDEDHVIEERGFDTNTMTETVTRQFIYGYRYPDDILAMDLVTVTQLLFYVKDANNNVTHLVDEAGQPAEFYTYDHLNGPAVFDPFMNPQPVSPTENPYFFTGRRHEP